MQFHIQRVAGALGAQVSGIDVSEPLGVEELEQVMNALADHSLLVFKQQSLGATKVVEFLEQFATILVPWTLTPETLSAENSNAMMISTRGHRYAGAAWHADYSFIEDPADYSAFYMSAVPSVGGNTAFASMYAAYETLSAHMKIMLDGLSAVHDNAHRHEQQYPLGDDVVSKETYAKLPPVKHPLVRVHPLTGRKALYFGAAVTKAIVGLPYLESRALINFLTEHCARLEFSYRHVWESGDLVLWDNRCATHCAVTDYDLNELREGLIVCARARLDDG